IEAGLTRLGAEIAAAPPGDAAALAHEQGDLQAAYERRDGYTWRARLEAALAGLGVGEALWRLDPDRLSGGERRRAALAAVLLTGGDVLLLDEPTNHLDLDAREWLEERLPRLPAAQVIVSHDRHFLDRVANRTLHLSRGRLTAWSGNYSFYLRASAETRAREEATWRRQSERIARTEDYIQRNIAGQKTKQAQSRRKQLARETRLERPEREQRGFNFKLAPERASGAMVLEVRDLAKGFGGAPLFHGLSLNVARGDRLGIIGPNGCGKSTLLSVLSGRTLPDRGRVMPGHNVDLGLYDQQLMNVQDANTVLEELASVWPGATLGQLRSFAGAFGFGADMIDRGVGRLSGGERGRLSLMRLIREGHNTLLLDEPTNHLDMQGRESLEAALLDFDGTLIVVSHDRRFLDRLVERLIVFETDPGGRLVTTVHPGNYSDLVAHRAGLLAETVTEVPAREKTARATRPKRTGPSKNEIRRLESRIAEAEQEIEALEGEKRELLDKLAAPDLAPADRLEVSRRCAAVDVELADRLRQWESWLGEIT
ncbi:ABC-F family ATP-binding cassette domain-containing protein, partial [bacterium]|nr:ABC-F family ATP-binding cassette domain-containing protein [bacterium]